MAKKLAYERYLWFHSQMKRGNFPGIARLMEKFEISRRQAAREIEFMRDFFNAPIEYSAAEKGYFYLDTSFELPGIWATEEEIVALIITKRLAGMIPDQKTRTRIADFFEKLKSHLGLNPEEIEKRISLKNIRICRVDPPVFQAAVMGISQRLKLDIHYDSPFSTGITKRRISPLHLLLYQGNWHLIGFCDLKQGLRDFVLSRISQVRLTGEAVSRELLELPVRKKIESNYGIFYEGSPTEVVLRFNARMKQLVKKQVWYPGQKMWDTEDGQVMLSFPVADFREITGDVLRLGADVEVVRPEALRKLIKDTISAMCAVYEK